MARLRDPKEPFYYGSYIMDEEEPLHYGSYLADNVDINWAQESFVELNPGDKVVCIGRIDLGDDFIEAGTIGYFIGTRNGFYSFDFIGYGRVELTDTDILNIQKVRK